MAATQGTQQDRVVVTWAAVADAGVYAVYRSDSPQGPYTYSGQSSYTTYVDLAVGPQVHYWYKVTALSFRGDAESAPGGPVEGWSNHVYAWQPPSPVDAPAARTELDADPADGSVYALALALVSDAQITVKRLGAANTWTALGASFGSTSGFLIRPAAMTVVAGIPYVAYVDQSVGGRVTVQAFVGGQRRRLGSGSLGAAPVSEVEITAGDHALFVGAITASTDPASRLPQVWRTALLLLPGAFGSSPADPSAATWSDISPATIGPVSNLGIVPLGDALYAAFERNDGSASATLTALAAATAGDLMTTPTWSSAVADLVTGDIISGYMDLAIDPTTQRLVVAYFVAGQQLFVRRGPAVLGNNWGSDLTQLLGLDASGQPVAAPAVTAYATMDSVGLTVTQAGTLILFYRDAASFSGVLQSLASTTWQVLSPTALTGKTGLSSFSITTFENRIYLGYIEGNAAFMRAYQ
ncbi:MAG: hypothetical protein ACKO4Z_05135 [Planctomycetota bacterium]